MNRYTFTARDEADTDRLGAVLAAALPERVVVALSGTLGAGKTRLVRALAAASGVAPEDVVSPTFILCQEYHGRRRLYHLDAYRIRDDEEFLDLGVEEYFEAPAITLVEWAERVRDCLPAERLEIEIRVAGETAREFTLTAHGDELAEVPAKLRKRLED
jgi:tRNA threonylcarbamoyladenosine biosynthesis protein TsaE